MCGIRCPRCGKLIVDPLFLSFPLDLFGVRKCPHCRAPIERG